MAEKNINWGERFVSMAEKYSLAVLRFLSVAINIMDQM